MAYRNQIKHFPMDQQTNNINDIISKTDYFQQCLENILALLQPSFYCLDLIVRILLHGPDGSGKRLLAKVAAKQLNMSFCEERVADLFDENIVGTEKKVRASINKLASESPCLLYYSGYELFAKLEDSDLDRIEHVIRESLDQLQSNHHSQPIVFIGSTNEFEQIYKTPLSEMFQHNISIPSPTLAQAEEILQAIKDELQLESDPCQKLYLCSNGEYYLGNLMNLTIRSELEHVKDRAFLEPTAGHNVDGTRWSDIGGLNEVKQEIIDVIQLTLDYPQLKKTGLRRTGILLYGPPGTGKTLLAKAVATECRLSFIGVKGPELLNEYVGQSEENVRKLFQRARESSPSVIFFDEIDSLAPNRGQAGDSGGVMDRMVSQILAEMDGAGKCDGVFIIGATNRVDLVDPSLLRPGRFDKVVEVPLPSGKDNRLQILKALTSRMTLSQDVDLDVIESMAKPNMSGADFQGLCSMALHKTFDRCIEQVESGQSTEDNIEMVTTMQDFIRSLREQ